MASEAATPGVPDAFQDTGLRLRLLRRRFGYSQRKLARLSGVSNAAISMIENGTLNPSIGTMVKILRALSISMADFWQNEPQAMADREQVFFRFEDLKKIANNKARFWQVPAGTDPSMIFQYECYEPGADSGVSQMQEECEMVGIVVEGAITFDVGDHSRVLRQGDVYRFDGRIPHRFRVRGKEPVTMVSCTSPAVF